MGAISRTAICSLLGLCGFASLFLRNLVAMLCSFSLGVMSKASVFYFLRRARARVLYLLFDVAISQAEARVCLGELLGALDLWETSLGPRWCVLNDHWGAPAGSCLCMGDYPGEAAEDPEVRSLCFHARRPVVFSFSRVRGCAGVPAEGPLAQVVPEGRGARRNHRAVGGERARAIMVLCIHIYIYVCFLLCQVGEKGK